MDGVVPLLLNILLFTLFTLFTHVPLEKDGWRSTLAGFQQPGPHSLPDSLVDATRRRCQSDGLLVVLTRLAPSAKVLMT